jgi:bacterioferritin-associated ferredoxin
VSAKTLFCRCEDVTLDEIRQAYDEGHRDFESLKRYTGFGTGWCQGRQCVVLCARFLAERGGALPDAPMTPRPPTHPMSLGHLARLGDALEASAPSATATTAGTTATSTDGFTPGGEGGER